MLVREYGMEGCKGKEPPSPKMDQTRPWRENHCSRGGPVTSDRELPSLIMRPKIDRIWGPGKGIVPKDGKSHRGHGALSQASHTVFGISPERGVDVPRGPLDDTIKIWTDSGWAEDVNSPTPCSGGYIQCKSNGGDLPLERSSDKRRIVFGRS